MFLFPNSRAFALTMSYDDGTAHDERLVSVFNKHGIKGSFHLNSANLHNGNPASHIQADRASEIFAGHEISCHTLTHPWPCEIPKDRLAFEVLQDRANLEKISGAPVRGMSYPFGQYDREVIATMRACGIDCSRTTVSTGGFGIPKDFMEWHPTCHHNAATEPAEKFLALVNEENPRRREMRLLYIWGHSYEFPRDDNWALIENLCARLGGNDKIWYATNIEICDYIAAVRAMRSTVDGTRFYNPSAISVWTANGEIKPGETVKM